jgi:hypothetical protein
MPADYLSRFPGAKDTIACITAFDPLQADLTTYRCKTMHSRCSRPSEQKNEWPPHFSKQDQAYYKLLAERVFQYKNKVVWVQLNDFKYPRTALYLPSRYRKEAMCEAHDKIFGGHNAAHKRHT